MVLVAIRRSQFLFQGLLRGLFEHRYTMETDHGINPRGHNREPTVVFMVLPWKSHTVILAEVSWLLFSIRGDHTRRGMNTRRQRSLGAFWEARCCTHNSEHAVPFAPAALASRLPGPLPSILLESSQMPLLLWSVCQIH